MEKEKDKIKETERYPKASQGKNDFITVSGSLRKSKIKISIKAKSKDWKILRNFYLPRGKEFFKDVYPFMQEGISKAYWKNKSPLQAGHNLFINSIKVLSALIYEIYLNMYKEKDSDNRKIKAIEATIDIIKSSLGDWAVHHGIDIFKTQRITEKKKNSFYIRYIQNGKKIIRTDDKKRLKDYLSTSLCILEALRIKGLTERRKYFNLAHQILIAANLLIDHSKSKDREIINLQRSLSTMFPSLIEK